MEVNGQDCIAQVYIDGWSLLTCLRTNYHRLYDKRKIPSANNGGDLPGEPCLV